MNFADGLSFFWRRVPLPISAPNLHSQSPLPIFAPSLHPQSSLPNLRSQSPFPVSTPNLRSQSPLPIFAPNLRSQSPLPISTPSLRSQSPLSSSAASPPLIPRHFIRNRPTCPCKWEPLGRCSDCLRLWRIAHADEVPEMAWGWASEGKNGPCRRGTLKLRSAGCPKKNLPMQEGYPLSRVGSPAFRRAPCPCWQGVHHPMLSIKKRTSAFGRLVRFSFFAARAFEHS